MVSPIRFGRCLSTTVLLTLNKVRFQIRNWKQNNFRCILPTQPTSNVGHFLHWRAVSLGKSWLCAFHFAVDLANFDAYLLYMLLPKLNSQDGKPSWCCIHSGNRHPHCRHIYRGVLYSEDADFLNECNISLVYNPGCSILAPTYTTSMRHSSQDQRWNGKRKASFFLTKLPFNE